MSDKITTLHLKNDPSTNVYPNVKIENIPLDVTITRDGENLAQTKTIYEFTTSKFLSLDGGTMKGNINTGGFASPEEAVLGDGLDVSDLSSQSEPVTHYGSGYIRQDDDEDSSVKYHYNFPKKSGTLALKEDLEGYATKEDITGMVTESEEIVFTPVEDNNVTINFSHIVKHGNIVFVHIGITITTSSLGYVKIGTLSVYPNHIHNNLVMATQGVNDYFGVVFGYANLRKNGEAFIYTQTGTKFYDYNTFFTIGE